MKPKLGTDTLEGYVNVHTKLQLFIDKNKIFIKYCFFRLLKKNSNKSVTSKFYVH